MDIKHISLTTLLHRSASSTNDKGRLYRPYRDWGLLLSLGALLLVASLTFGLWLFFSISREVMSNPVPVVENISVATRDITVLLDEGDRRKARFETLKGIPQ